MSTEKDAVNSLLIAKGIAPVQELTDGHPAVAAARDILSRWSTLIQDRGWWFNRDYKVQLSRDIDNKVAIPLDVIRVDGPAQYVVIDRYLYDALEHTNVFDEAPKLVDLIRKRTWENLPPAAYNHIVALAKEEYIRSLESPLKTRQAMNDISYTRAALVNANLDNLDISAFQTNPLVQRLKSKLNIRIR